MKRRPIRNAIESIARALDPKVVSAVTTLAESTDEPARSASTLDGDFNPLPPVATKPRMNISSDLLRKLGGAPDPSMGAAISQSSPRTHQGTTAIRAQFQAEQLQRAANNPFKR
jgi:hypothetical protein